MGVAGAMLLNIFALESQWEVFCRDLSQWDKGGHGEVSPGEKSSRADQSMLSLPTLPLGKTFVEDLGLILGSSWGFVTSGSFNLEF